MKKAPLIITVIIVLLAAGAFFVYDRYFTEKKIQAWDVVPTDALIVYEKENCQECVQAIRNSALWKILKLVVTDGNTSDSLKEQLLSKAYDADQLLFSLHATKKDDFDFVFYSESFTPGAIAEYLNKPSFRLTQRAFNGISIHEMSYAKNIFSWAMIENVWVGSFTPFLIEDVIRTWVRKDGLRRTFQGVQQMPQMKDDAGTLYVSTSNFSQWLSLFSAERDLLTEPLAHSTVLDVKAEENNLFLNGFTTENPTGGTSMLSIFKNQSPVSFNQKNYISNRTVMLHTFGVSSGSTFVNDLFDYRNKRRKIIQDSLLQIEQPAKVKFQEFFRKIQGEVGVCFVESNRGNKLSKVILIESQNVGDLVSDLNKISETFSKDTIFYERYGEYEIREVPVFNFTEKLFWPLVSGFNQNYFTTTKNFLIIGDDLADLKQFLLDVDDDNTWGKSVSYNKFLETTLLESNLSIYINTPRTWNFLSRQLHPRWSQFAKENQALMRSLNMGAIQFSHLNNTFYTNVSLAHQPVNASGKSNRPRDHYVTNYEVPLMNVYTVKSHVNRSDEVLVQDSLNDLSLVSSDGKVLWKIAVGDPITSEVSQVDYFANGKLQYFFTTRSALHIVDRLGNYVDPFPVHIGPTLIEKAQVIDYDNSKKYRFLVAEQDGKLWMYDKEGRNLEGWQPKYVNGRLLTEAQHHRIKGKDYIIAIRRDGVVDVMNRRGEDIKGFPLKLNSTLAGEYFLENGSTLSDTYFVVITRDGFRIKFNLEGKIQSRETLLKTSVNTQFALISEKLNKSYLILQQDSRGFNILDENGKTIITNDAIGTNPTLIKYYDFGSGNKFVTVIDQAQELTYVYDGEGNLLSSPPVESSLLELRPLDSDQIRLFFIHGNSLHIQPMQ